MAPNSRSFAPQVFGFPPKTTLKVKTNQFGLLIQSPEGKSPKPHQILTTLLYMSQRLTALKQRASKQ